MMRLEHLILRNLIQNKDYTKKVIPFLKKDYFAVPEEAALFETIADFINKYNTVPNVDPLHVEIDNITNLSDSQISETHDLLKDLDISKRSEDENNIDWLMQKTEAFCQEKAVYLAMTESIAIANGQSQKSKGEIPLLLAEALAVSFDTHVGHDYLDEYQLRYDFMHRIEARIPFDIDFFNMITNGGVPSKTLNVILAGTGVGKTLFMCHLASSYLLQGKNVLYITMEMAEEMIAQRIDANLLDCPLDDLKLLPQDLYSQKVRRLQGKTNGKLIIKEYPTSQAGALHFRSLLNDLFLKKGFKPDVIFIDYINICASSRFRPGTAGMYEYVKAVAEELRGLAVEKETTIWTATQTNRTGFTSSDPGLEDTAESFGLPATADFMFTLVSSETLEEQRLLSVKQLKNRYAEINPRNRRFYVKIDKPKMKLYNATKDDHSDLPEVQMPKSQSPDRFQGMKV